MSTESTSDVGELFSRAVIGLDDDSAEISGVHPTRWYAVTRLRQLGNGEVLSAALEACADLNPTKRRVGAAVLGQLGASTSNNVEPFREERFQGLMSLLATEREGARDPEVLASVCFALGHLNDPRAIPALIELRGHPEAGVRFGVTSGLSSHDIPEAIDGLIALSADDDDHVRDWATFGLGQEIVSDTPAIRAALRARIDDPYQDARNEAIEGLAVRGDRSVLPVLIRELRQQVAVPLLDAAIALATPELCDALAAAADGGLVWEAHGQRHDLTDHWREARQACGCSV